MLEALSKQRIALLWGNFKNLIDFNEIELPSEIWLKGANFGEFPVDSYFPIYLEVAKGLKKQDISSRTNNSSTTTNWSYNRIVNLPEFKCNYENREQRIGDFFKVINEWNSFLFLDDIPCIAIAVKVKGNYCDEREAQFVKVLIIWSKYIARILTLEYFEGPIEDCISPEWYITSSDLLSISESINEMCNIQDYLPNWQSSVFSVLSNPTFFIDDLVNGFLRESLHKNWKNERFYLDRLEFQTDINVVCNILLHKFLQRNKQLLVD